VHAFFAYGTLLHPEVLEAVTGRAFAPEPATLPGHARYCVKGAVYPAAVAEPGASIEGALYRGLDDACLEALDRFEGSLYRRVRREVALAAGGRARAYVYEIASGRRDVLEPLPWDPAAFASRHLARYVAACRASRGPRAAPAVGG